ncbi:hypothetical protein [Desulfonema ishimotonii]|uniref:hypothetical protein n=1 Tax=Desulfonema ishimotonii TaxID=45657 RepID=UPI000F5766B2|nr:hypothetical protein [Desulfonema ishimotonii]
MVSSAAFHILGRLANFPKNTSPLLYDYLFLAKELHMAFDIYGPETHLADDSCDYEMLEFASSLNKKLPFLEKLLNKFYNSTEVKIQEISLLKCELEFVRKKYQEKIIPIIIKEKRIYSKNRKIYKHIIAQLLMKDRMYNYLSDFINICDEADEKNTTIRCIGD